MTLHQPRVLNPYNTKVLMCLSLLSLACPAAQLICVWWSLNTSCCYPDIFWACGYSRFGHVMDTRKHNMLPTVHYTPKMCIIKKPKHVWASPKCFWNNINWAKRKQWRKRPWLIYHLPSRMCCCMDKHFPLGSWKL
jgi:hypothetical protein